MNIIANKIIDIVNEHAKNEGFNPNRGILLCLCGGDENTCDTILNHSKYIQSKTNVLDIYRDEDNTGRYYSIEDKDVCLRIEKGEMML